MSEGNVSETVDKYTFLDDQYFSIIDYMLFACMLIISTAIGIYYGFLAKTKQNTTAEYILGGKHMSIVPVASSLIASHISGTSMLGLPADVYGYGTQYIMCFIPLISVGLSLQYIYLPVFYEMELTSCFMYLERRFDRRVRVTASLVYALSCILFIPIVIYVPALAFNQVSGVNIYIVSTCIGLLCVFYTTVGGLKAVVWTDTIQFASIIGSYIAVIYLGTLAKGGVSEIFAAADRGARLIFFDLNPSPFERMTLLSITIGMSFLWMAIMSSTQSTIQRCLALPSMEKAIKMIWVFVVGVYVMKLASIYVGLLIYAEYENCDPLSAGIVKKLDQIVPLYTMNIAGRIPGLPGIFIAGIFAASLSSMSSTLNTLSGTIFDDLIKPHLKRKNDENRNSKILKLIVMILGAFEIGMVFIVEKLGAVLHLTYSVNGLTSGTLLGIFTIGMLSRKVNTTGVVAGSITSLICVGTILVGAQYSIKPPTLPFDTNGCDLGNETVVSNATALWMTHIESYEKVPLLFRISFLYYALIGVSIMTLVAYPVSLLTAKEDYDVEDCLLAPFMRRNRHKNFKHTEENVVQYKIVQEGMLNSTVASDAEEKL